MPEKLSSYLKEQIDEGSTIISTTSEDAYMWIIKPSGLGEWLNVCTWYEGHSDFQLIGITGRGFNELYKAMTEAMKP